jgi:hypothetical protein
MPDPPTTFYGPVLAGPGLTPIPGTTVTAWIDGHFCGQGRTLEADGEIVYTIDVFADGLGYAGCGASGRPVWFKVRDQTMWPAAVWNSDRLWRVALASRARLYLPLVVKKR